MPSWTAILFDLDDTLFAEREFIASGFHAVSRYLAPTMSASAESIFQEFVAIFQDGPRDRVFDAWLEEHGVSDQELRDRMIALYRQHPPEIRLRPGMRELIDTLRRNRKLGIVSDGLLATQQGKLAALELSPLFATIILSDQWGRAFWKPHVRPFRAALAQLQTLPERTVYIGDNPHKDFAPCRTLGMASVRLRLPDGIYYDREPSSAADEPDMTVNSVAELSAFLVDNG